MKNYLTPIFNSLFKRNQETHLEDVLIQYTDKKRVYHDIFHISGMIHLLQSHSAHVNNYNEIMLAIIYHDYIYDINASSGENEHKSSLFLQSISSDIKNGIDINFSRTLIEATASHKISETVLNMLTPKQEEDLRFFLDCDLMVFAREDYLFLDQKVREEYNQYSDDVFNKGRLKVLSYFNNIENIYTSKTFKHLNEIAHKNLNNLIKIYTLKVDDVNFFQPK